MILYCASFRSLSENVFLFTKIDEYIKMVLLCIDLHTPEDPLYPYYLKPWSFQNYDHFRSLIRYFWFRIFLVLSYYLDEFETHFLKSIVFLN